MELRTYVLIDSMQPQYAAFTGSTLSGDVPVAGMAEIFIELSPASEVYETLDVALKSMDVKPAQLQVGREFGTLEIHSFFQEAVITAGQAALTRLNLSEQDRTAPEVVSVKTVTNVDAYEAQLVNKRSYGGLLLQGQTLCVLEVVPAGYIVLAANEAEKAANITLVHYAPSGRYGRLYLAGMEAEINVAREAAVQAINGLSGRPA